MTVGLQLQSLRLSIRVLVVFELFSFPFISVQIYTYLHIYLIFTAHLILLDVSFSFLRSLVSGGPPLGWLKVLV